jgi:ATP dependent DNA ligase domain
MPLKLRRGRRCAIRIRELEPRSCCENVPTGSAESRRGILEHFRPNEIASLRPAADRASFIESCLPSPADKPPSGSNWIHEIKHDGFRLMVRRDPVGIRLITRRGNDWTQRYPLVAEAVNHLKVRSCLIDGEVVCCDERGVAIFSKLRQRRNEARAFLFAFDLLELDGLDMRREPIETRKATLASLLRKSRLLLDYPWGLCAFRGDCRAVRAALSQLAALEDCPAAGFGAGVIRGLAIIRCVSSGGVPLAARSFGHGRNSHIRRRNAQAVAQPWWARRNGRTEGTVVGCRASR